jgi:hypothetical protein
MIISHIIGGLGNQMFQYATGRAMALRHHQSLLLDISGFADYGLHQGFELKRVFDCSAEIASEHDLRKILGWQHSPFARRALIRPRLAMFRCREFVVEPHFQYWAGLDDVAPESYLVGYWQSEKYFSGVAAQIRHDFTFRLPLNNLNAAVAEQISSVRAVSLHVRRGDYVNNPNTTATHGLCSLDYYWDAVRYISEQVSHPHFFVFSDDIVWVKENLNIDFPCQYVNHNQGAESYNDMRLMSMCQHHIIANSSFSWWGAWLNPKANKVVVAPQRWFANQSDVRDLLPKSWVSL